jgi:hypothetical protein
MTEANDVTSFGRVMYELVTWGTPLVEVADLLGNPSLLIQATDSQMPSLPPVHQLPGGQPPPDYTALMEVIQFIV